MKRFNHNYLMSIVLIQWCSLIAAQPFQWGLAARQGDRPTMEDEHTHMVREHDAFFGMYDGHGGTEAATYAAATLYKNFFNWEKEKPTHTKDNLVEAFEQTDKEILKKTPSGAVAAVAYLCDATADKQKRNQAFIAWAGDSRVLVVRSGSVVFHTTDHKPNAKEEKERIEAFGMQVQHWGVPRIMGLAISRTLGDAHVKEQTKGVVTATPQVATVPMQAGDLIILACDGVWDVISNEEAAKLVFDITSVNKSLEEMNKEYPATPVNGSFKKEQLVNQGTSNLLQIAARALRDEAYNRKSHDNISVMVVSYQPEAERKDEINDDQEEKKAGSEKEKPAKEVATTKNQILIDRMNELLNMARKNKLNEIATSAQNALTLLKSQSYTADVLRLVQEFLNDIDANTQIKYFEGDTTLKTLLDPIKNTISRDLKRLKTDDHKQ